MKPLSRLIRPLGDAARAFFKADLSLRRDARGLQLVLEERPRAPRETPAQAKERRERELLAQMQRELAQALDEHPGTRQALRHLVCFESKFRRKGLRALQRTPVPVLRRALEQFESLVSNWSPVGLAALRSKMAVAVIERESEIEDDSARGPDSTLEDEMLLSEPAVQVLDGDADAAMDGQAELAAAYAAALGAAAAPAGGVELQGELGSRAAVRAAPTPAGKVDLRLRELQP